MTADWRTYRLGDLFEVFSGLSKPREEFGFGHPFLTFKDVFYNYFLPDELGSLANTTDKERDKCSIKCGDVFLTRTSETADELGMSCVALKDYPEATFNGFTKRLRLKPDVDVQVDPVFLGYYLRSQEFRQQVTAVSSITTRASLNTKHINALEVKLPEYDEQVSIGQVLKPLDDRIELNRRMNGTLEALAQAVFKEWFVEKVEQGWKENTIGDLAEVIGGATPSTKNEAFWTEHGHAWATPKDLSSLQTPVLLDTERHLTDEGLAEIGSGLLPIGTVLMSSRAPIGYIAIAEVPTAVNQGFIAMKAKPGVSNLFLWQWTKQNMDEIKSRANGSTFQEISKTNFRPIAVAVPPPAKMKAYDTLVRPMYERLAANERESRTLTALRDTLLPKMMRGEVRVKEGTPMTHDH